MLKIIKKKFENRREENEKVKKIRREHKVGIIKFRREDKEKKLRNL